MTLHPIARIRALAIWWPIAVIAAHGYLAHDAGPPAIVVGVFALSCSIYFYLTA